MQAPVNRNKVDNDEACAIDSETSSSDDAEAVSDEEEEVKELIKRKQRNTSDQLMEDSVRTANFKGTPTLPPSNLSHAASTAHTQDSYYTSTTAGAGLSFTINKQKYAAELYYKSNAAVEEEKEQAVNSARRTKEEATR
jgi:hypothetical protein